MKTYSDEDRKQRVLQSPHLFHLQQTSKRPLKAWVKENRALIDGQLTQVQGLASELEAGSDSASE